MFQILIGIRERQVRDVVEAAVASTSIPTATSNSDCGRFLGAQDDVYGAKAVCSQS